MFRFTFLFLLISHFLFGSDSLFLKVHFVYGSKPKAALKKIEHKQFGGIHGGHVYLEFNNKIISYGSNNGKWHLFPHKSKNAGKYRIDKDLKWHADTGKLKITSIVIPITKLQLDKLTQTEQIYFSQTPYDYAFIGMRCAAGAYDMLCHGDVCKPMPRSRIVTKYFYPKKLRKRLLKRAEKENWQVHKQDGRETRKWEKD